ncbi:MAG: hypothetical protein IJM36_03625 [Acholeplasmatales bacterium]|nr:hypothetical protein [Acholeplasmatales bacterium]
MFFLLGCAKNTSVEDNINNQNDVDSTDSIDESLVGFSFSEIYGVGYSVSKIYNSGETIIIPSEYNNKPVVAIERSAFYAQINVAKNIVIPNSIKLIEPRAFIFEHDNYNNINISIYYDGTGEDWIRISTYYSVSVDHDGEEGILYKLYVSNETGDVNYNGKTYRLYADIEKQ